MGTKFAPAVLFVRYLVGSSRPFLANDRLTAHRAGSLHCVLHVESRSPKSQADDLESGEMCKSGCPRDPFFTPSPLFLAGNGPVAFEITGWQRRQPQTQ